MAEPIAHPHFIDAVRDVFGGSPWRFLAGVCSIILVFIVVGWLAHDPIEAAATHLVERVGTIGIFFVALAGEIVPPFGFQPALFLGYSGGMPAGRLLLLVEAGSFVASCSCWAIGAALRRAPRALAWLDQRRSARLFRRYGTTTVGIAALAPVPYGAITLLAGALGLPFGPAVAGMLWRPVKIGFSLALLMVGWAR